MTTVLEIIPINHAICSLLRFKALVRASPSGFTLLSGLFSNGSAFQIAVPNLAGFENLLGLNHIK